MSIARVSVSKEKQTDVRLLFRPLEDDLIRLANRIEDEARLCPVESFTFARVEPENPQYLSLALDFL